MSPKHAKHVKQSIVVFYEFTNLCVWLWGGVSRGHIWVTCPKLVAVGFRVQSDTNKARQKTNRAAYLRTTKAYHAVIVWCFPLFVHLLLWGNAEILASYIPRRTLLRSFWAYTWLIFNLRVTCAFSGLKLFFLFQSLNLIYKTKATIAVSVSSRNEDFSYEEVLGSFVRSLSLCWVVLIRVVQSGQASLEHGANNAREEVLSWPWITWNFEKKLHTA